MRKPVPLKQLIEGLKENAQEFLNPTPGDVHVNQPMGKKKKKLDEGIDTHQVTSMPIFKLGQWKGENFSLGDLDEIVKNTNLLMKAGLIEPPIKLGHNEEQTLLQNDGYPAGGYVRNLTRVGDQIFADVTDVPEKLYTLMQKRAYSNVSAEIYEDFEHPVTKEHMGKVLRAVALLGADIPEVKALGDILTAYYKENKLAYVSFSEKDLKEAYHMAKKWKLAEIEKAYPCCSDKAKKYMEEKKLDELDADTLASIVTEVNMSKFADDTTAAGAAGAGGEPEPECPPGHKWDATAQKCVVTNAADKDKPEEQKLCPKGFKWDDKENKCVKAEVAENNDNKGANAAKSPKDMLAEIMTACGFKKDDQKDIMEQFPGPQEFLSNVADIYMKAKGEKITPEEKKFIEGMVRLFEAGGAPEPQGMDKEPHEWTDEEKEGMKKKHKDDPNPNKDKEIEGYPDDKRPPKGWWDKCIASVKDKTDTPEQLCGHIYAHQLSPAAKSKAEATRAAEQAPETAKLRELNAKIRKLTMEKYTEKVVRLRDDNRGVFIPALDPFIDSFLRMYTENDSAPIVKFKESDKTGEADIAAPELFVKFMDALAKSKTVIFKEIARVEKEDDEKKKTTATKEEVEKVSKKYTEASKGKTVKGAELAASAKKLSEEKHIPLRDAMLQVSKTKKEGE